MIKMPNRLGTQGNYPSIMWLPRWHSEESDCQWKRWNRQRFRAWVWPRSPGEGNSNSLQYSCLGNSMETGAYPSPVVGYIAHGVTPARQTHTHTHTHTHTQQSRSHREKKKKKKRKQHIQLWVFPSKWETRQKCLPIALQHRSGRKALS